MRIIQSIAYETLDEDELREAIDSWVEVGDWQPIMDKWLALSEPLGYKETVYRLEHGSRGRKALAELKVGSMWDLSAKSTCESLDALEEGVIEPTDPDPDSSCVLWIDLSAHEAWGRSVRHSNRRHPENKQEEFLLMNDVKGKVIEVKEYATEDGVMLRRFMMEAVR